MKCNTRYLHRIIRVEKKISSSSFDYSETRVIFIEEYVSTMISVHPTSIAMKHALFSSKNTCGRINEVHPASIAVKHVSFSSLSLNEIDEIMIVFIKSYFLSHKGRRPNVRRPNGRAPKRRRPNGGAQTAAPKRPAPNYMDALLNWEPMEHVPHV